eukprot:3171617-Pyramimonas_sp.AAC.1
MNNPFPSILLELCSLVIDLGIGAFPKDPSTKWNAVPGETFPKTYLMSCLFSMLIAKGGNA